MDQRLFITTDVDWAHDEVIEYALDVFRSEAVPVTVFATHDSAALARLRAADTVELAVHPDFNPLLNGGTGGGGSVRQRVEQLLEVVPAARSVRTHCLVQSSRLLDLFADMGFTHEVNTLLPAGQAGAVRPWRHWRGGLVRVPYLFDDSLSDLMDGGWSVKRILDIDGPKVVNFHPGRLFLNQRESVIPEAVQALRQRPAEFVRHRRDDGALGSLSFARELIRAHRDGGGHFGLISEIRPEQEEPKS
jgi:hypothetical protein